MQSAAPCRPPRRGLTLVELLTVIAIIGVLVALLAPATVRVLARGRLTECTNNQYQIAFALLRYDETKRQIPGWLNDNPGGVAGACSWPVELLPFLGRNDIYDMWPSLPNDPTINIFVCPASRTRESPGYPVLHYAGNIGASGLVANDGVFLFRYQDSVSAGSGPNMPPVFGAATPPGPLFPVLNRSDTALFAPSSTHPDGVVVAFCDGHTGFLKDDLQPYEYGQLLTPKSRWQGTTNKTNSTAMQPWLLKNGLPYLLDESILKK
jgi:prepilin-type N-terminal cleavage/methylation domain-containing protein/prepilin-type processing-associated H-X9-DG protein